MVPQRSHSEIDRIARQRNVAGAKLVCRATQLPRLAADELRQRNRAAVGIDGGPFVRVHDMKALRRAAQRAGRQPKLRAPRPRDGRAGREVLLADDRAADGEPRDEMRHQRAVDVAHPDDQVEVAGGQRALGILVEVRAQPFDGEAALGRGCLGAVERYAARCRARVTA